MRQTTMEWIRSTHGDDQDHDDQVDEDDDNNNVADYDEAGADLHNGGLALQERQHECKSFPTGYN